MSGQESIPASELKVGDTIEVWWGVKRATVCGFRAHGKRTKGWAVSDFTDGQSMTITPYDRVKVVPVIA